MSDIRKFIIDNLELLKEKSRKFNQKEIFKQCDLSCSPITFSQYFRKYIDISENKELRKTFNSFYFDKIDSSEKAYLLGFIVADGCLYKPTNTLIIFIGKKDEEVIYRFIAAIGQGSFSEREKLNERCQNMVRLTYRSEYMLNSINNLGIPFNKSKIEFGIPKIPEEFIPAFIAGYFDGDGSISVSAKKSTNVETCFTDSNFILLNEIKDYLTQFGITGYIRKRENYYQYRISGRYNAKRFFDNVYSKVTTLQRKYNKFLDTIPC